MIRRFSFLVLNVLLRLFCYLIAGRTNLDEFLKELLDKLE